MKGRTDGIIPTGARMDGKLAMRVYGWQGKCGSVISLTIGHGVPDDVMMSANYARKISISDIPVIEEAQDSYEASGGQLADAADFGEDPLRGNEALRVIREREFAARNGKIDVVFHNVVNGNPQPLFDAICTFAAITEDIARRHL